MSIRLYASPLKTTATLVLKTDYSEVSFVLEKSGINVLK